MTLDVAPVDGLFGRLVRRRIPGEGELTLTGVFGFSLPVPSLPLGAGRDGLGEPLCGRALVLGPISEATLLDHATDTSEAIEDQSDELQGLFEPPSELVQVNARRRSPVRIAARVTQRSGKTVPAHVQPLRQ